MLTIIMPLTLLLVMKPKWNFSTLYLASLVVPMTMYMYLNSLPINFNSVWGLDLMSSSLMTLTLWIMPLVIVASQNISLKNLTPRSFLFYTTILELILIMSFCASHLLSFYILFEASLIPTLLIVLKWGYQPERLQAGMYLMLYTITASLPLLAGIAIHTFVNYSYSMFLPYQYFAQSTAVMWMVMNLAFMVKLPLFLAHLWLPKAHVEAPVAGSMILAAVLLKLGGYGMLRLIYMSSPIAPSCKYFILTLALWGGMITSLICIRQQDMKSLIAYSSVGHMSLVMAGVLSNLQWGMWGAVAMMISHGLLSSALFASADMNYSMSNSRSLLMNKGLNIAVPSLSMVWFIMCAANMAAPPSSNLMAEIMLITSSTNMSKLMLAPLGLMSFAAAAYSLTLYVSMNHGPINNLNNPSMSIIPRNLLVISGHTAPLVIIMLMPSLIVLW